MPYLLLLLSSVAWSQRLLHLGNSYTFYNDLDQTTAALLSAGGTSWEAERLAAGGLLFTDHLDRTAQEGSPWQAALVDTEQAWDWVVLQEQSQIPGFPESDSYVQASTEAAAALDDLAEARGAQTVFLLTWGRRDGDSTNPDRFPDFTTMQAHLTDGYLRYRDATATEARPTWIAPVGLAFAHVHDSQEDPRDPEGLFWSLYDRDGSHPSPAGTYLAACVLYVTLTGESAEGLPSPSEIDGTTRLTLQQAADAAVFESATVLDYPWSRDDTTAPEDTATPRDTAQVETPASSDSSDTKQPDAGGCAGAAWVLVGTGLLGWRRYTLSLGAALRSP